MENKNHELSQQRQQKVATILAMLANNIDHNNVVHGNAYFREGGKTGSVEHPAKLNTLKVEPVMDNFVGHWGADDDKIQFRGCCTREYSAGEVINETAVVHLYHYCHDVGKSLGTIKTQKKVMKAILGGDKDITATTTAVISPGWRDNEGNIVTTRVQHESSDDFAIVKIYCTAREYKQGTDVVLNRLYDTITRVKQPANVTAPKLGRLKSQLTGERER